MTDSGRISFSLRELARRFGGEIAGDPGFEVRGVASLESAAPTVSPPRQCALSAAAQGDSRER
jgi:hypothetical protein